MKKLLLLPIVLFVMLVAAMVNPFGCREKKPGLVEIGATTIKGTKDTSPVLGKVVKHYFDAYIEGADGGKATRDSLGNWSINGKCSEFLETIYKNSIRINESLFKAWGKSDSLQKELNNIKANKAEYRYAEIKTGEGLGLMPMNFDTVDNFIDTGTKWMSEVSDYKWKMISGPNFPTSIPDEDSFVFQNPLTGEFDIKIHRKDLPKKLKQ